MMFELLLAAAGFMWSLFAPATCGPAEPIFEIYNDGGAYVGIIADGCDFSSGFDVLPGGGVRIAIGAG